MPIRVRPPGLVISTLLAVALLLVAGTSGVIAAERGVRIVDFAFAPRTVTITVGDRVTWTNRDAVEHTATAVDGSFDTGLLANGESATFRFTSAGTYRYLCTPHPSMTGTVVVRAADEPAPPPTDTLDAVLGAAPGGLPLLAIGLVGLAALAVIWPRRGVRPD